VRLGPRPRGDTPCLGNLASAIKDRGMRVFGSARDGICEAWTRAPAIFKINPHHLISGPHTVRPGAAIIARTKTKTKRRHASRESALCGLMAWHPDRTKDRRRETRGGPAAGAK
jgi:hypothetical protein